MEISAAVESAFWDEQYMMATALGLLANSLETL
jgi:hypothetical protein